MRTNPIGVRFDPEKLEYIKAREKLTTNQQVVDLLVNKYWWEHKMPIPTHKEAPPLDLKLEITNSFATPTPSKLKIKYYQNEESPLSFQELLNGIEPLVFPDEKEEYAKKIQNAKHLSQKQRDILFTNLRTQR